MVCPGCGEWSSERPVEDGAVVCGCGYRHPIALWPLLLVTGASGTGKSTLALRLAGHVTDAVVLDQDILWMPEMDTPGDNWRRFRSLWLRMAVNIGQSGRPVLLFGSADPIQYESLPERRYLTGISTLALVCGDDELRRRLRSRPAWRQAGSAEFIHSMLEFNRSMYALAERQPQSVTLLDTTNDAPDVSAAAISSWAKRIISEHGGVAW